MGQLAFNPNAQPGNADYGMLYIAVNEVISHNSKYGMQNAKDSSKAETYYNKRHGSEKITKILSLVNESFLDGEALKSQPGK